MKIMLFVVEFARTGPAGLACSSFVAGISDKGVGKRVSIVPTNKSGCSLCSMDNGFGLSKGSCRFAVGLFGSRLLAVSSGCPSVRVGAGMLASGV